MPKKNMQDYLTGLSFEEKDKIASQMRLNNQTKKDYAFFKGLPDVTQADRQRAGAAVVSQKNILHKLGDRSVPVVDEDIMNAEKDFRYGNTSAIRKLFK